MSKSNRIQIVKVEQVRFPDVDYPMKRWLFVGTTNLIRACGLSLEEIVSHYCCGRNRQTKIRVTKDSGETFLTLDCRKLYRLVTDEETNLKELYISAGWVKKVLKTLADEREAARQKCVIEERGLGLLAQMQGDKGRYATHVWGRKTGADFDDYPDKVLHWLSCRLDGDINYTIVTLDEDKWGVKESLLIFWDDDRYEVKSVSGMSRCDLVRRMIRKGWVKIAVDESDGDYGRTFLIRDRSYKIR